MSMVMLMRILWEMSVGALYNEVMDKARVFLHVTINEHWGIAVAEAMARGLSVVVYKSGGTWSDIAEEGKYGLGYRGAEEAPGAIPGLLTNQKVWKEFSINC
jgi:glycosyltransferase involved in cell wall biosynthesis